MRDYLSDLASCTLCEWKCRVNRLEGERGVCGVGRPIVASCTLHPAPPRSYTVFLGGCNYRCLGCQNWQVAYNPSRRGYVDPEDLARKAYSALESPRGRRMGADRLFFSGGSPTPSLPYVERVVREARKLGPVKVNYDTNGFLTRESLERVLDFANSITFDVKAYHDDVHRALTGAPVGPVLRNAQFVAEWAPEKIWEYRVPIIPGVNEGEARRIAGFLAGIDESLPLNFLAFRPNFILEDHPGATRETMERVVRVAREAGLEDVSWSGKTGISGKLSGDTAGEYETRGARLAGGIAKSRGCRTHPRNCGACKPRACPIAEYRPARST